MAMDRSLPEHEMIPQLISETLALEHAIQAIGIVMVMPNGLIKTKLAFKEGQKLSLLAGVDLFHADLRSQIAIDPDNAPENLVARDR